MDLELRKHETLQAGVGSGEELRAANPHPASHQWQNRH
jgi:hypothetical protein